MENDYEKQQNKGSFEKAEEQIQVDEIRKQETYNMMLETMEKQRTPMMSIKNILLHQIWYMDKVFFIIYGVIICLEIVSIAALQYIGVNQNEIIIACMVGAGILSVVSISIIDKVFLEEWRSQENVAISIRSSVWLRGWHCQV